LLKAGWCYFDQASRAELSAIGVMGDDLGLFSDFLEAFQETHLVTGDANKLPSGFVISKSDARYSDRVRSMPLRIRKLKQMAYSVRVSGRFSDRRADLETAGFDFTPQYGEPQAVLAAFRAYKSMFGDLNVGRHFIVPSVPPWPEYTWGFRLEAAAKGIRANGHHAQLNGALNEMGFLFDK